MAQDGYKYWAFISYSHRDRAWGNWLHQTLETYRVPSRLVGRDSRDGKVPARMFPIFRDRDELPSSADLGGVINQALADSRYQIVICSPRSAASRWVNEEVRHFKSLGRSDRVLCLIVDGEPNVFDVPGRDIEECFAPALRFKVNADGVITDIPAEPIAADAREHADGKAGAKLKLLSGLLGVGFDELKQREQQRQFWKRVQAIAAGLAFAGMVAGAWQWYTHQRDAREREIVIEKIVEYGRQELLDGHQARAAVFLNQAYKMGNDSAAVRFMLGQAMHPVEALTKVRIHHGGKAVHGAAFSPDDRQIALVILADDGAGHERAVAQVYDSATGKLQVELPGAPLRPSVIRFLPDGYHLMMTGTSLDSVYSAVRSSSDTFLWDLRSPAAPLRLPGNNGPAGMPVDAAGREFIVAKARTLQFDDATSGAVTHELHWAEEITAATFSPDGASIALAGAGGDIEILSPGGKTLRKLQEAKGQHIKGLMFTPDGQRLLSWSDADDVRVWELSTGHLAIAFAADANQALGLQFSQDGKRLLTIGSAGYKVWSATRGTLLLDLQRNLKNLASAALSPDGSTLVTADYENNAAEVWDVLAKRKLYSLDFHTSGVSAVAFSLSGDSLLLGSRDGSADIWRMPVAPVWKYVSFEGLLPYVARFDASGRRLLAAGGNWNQGGALIFDAMTHQLLEQHSWHKTFAFDAALNRDGTRLATASADGTAVLWDQTQHRQVALLDHRPAQISKLEFSSDGKRLATFADNLDLSPPDQRVGLWDALDGHRVAWLPTDGYVWAVAFDPNGAHLASAGEDGRIKLWSAADGHLDRVIDTHHGRVRSVEFSADGLQLLAAQNDAVSLWSTQSSAELSSFQTPALGLPIAATFSRDGHQIAIGTQEGNIWLWRPHGGAASVLKGHVSAIRGLRFLQRSGLLLSYGDDGTARVWDAAAGVEVGRVAAHEGGINLVDLDADEQRLVTSTWGQLAQWDMRLEQRSPETIGHILAGSVPWVYDAAAVRLLQSAPGVIPPAHK